MPLETAGKSSGIIITDFGGNVFDPQLRIRQQTGDNKGPPCRLRLVSWLNQLNNCGKFFVESADTSKTPDAKVERSDAKVKRWVYP